jgi:hypothetical protein
MALTPVVTTAYLQRRFGSTRLVQLFDDDHDGVADTTKLTEAIAEATAKVYAHIRRSWAHSDAESMLSDEVVLGITADLVMSIGMKGRPEFTDGNGVNPWTGNLSKSGRETLDDVANAKLRLPAEETVSANAHVGGTNNAPDPPFVFARSSSGGRPGGY